MHVFRDDLPYWTTSLHVLLWGKTFLPFPAFLSSVQFSYWTVIVPDWWLLILLWLKIRYLKGTWLGLWNWYLTGVQWGLRTRYFLEHSKGSGQDTCLVYNEDSGSTCLYSEGSGPSTCLVYSEGSGSGSCPVYGEGSGPGICLVYSEGCGRVPCLVYSVGSGSGTFPVHSDGSGPGTFLVQCWLWTMCLPVVQWWSSVC